MLETIILISVVGLLMMFSFLLGARTSQKAYKKEEIVMPTLNPIKAFQEHKEKVERTKEEKEFNTMMENINNYDGTSLGQKDF